MLKAVIIVLVLAVLASLGSGFYYLMKDQGDKSKRGTLHSLGIRIALAIALLATIIYGVATGQLGHSTPWDAGPAPAKQHSSASKDIDKQK